MPLSLMMALMPWASGEELPTARDLVAYVTAVSVDEPAVVVLGIQGDIAPYEALWKSFEVRVIELGSTKDPARAVRSVVKRMGAGCGVTAVPKQAGFTVELLGTCEAKGVQWDPETFDDPLAIAPAPEIGPEEVDPEEVEQAPAQPVAVDDTPTGALTVGAIAPGEFSRLVTAGGDTLRITTNEELAEAGLDLHGVEGGRVVDRNTSTRFELSGRFEDARVRIADGRSRAEVTIRWQLSDSTVAKVVYVATTRGYASEVEASRERIVLAALERATRSLSELLKFIEVLQRRDRYVMPAPDWEGSIEVERCATAAGELPANMPKVLNAVGVVKTESGVGTGVFISASGFLPTADHVVKGEREIEVRLSSGVTLSAKVVRGDQYQDVALLDVAGDGYACLPLGVLPTPGQDLFAVGNPLGAGLEFSVSRGIVSGLRSFSDYKFIQTDASINRGYSGGPLMNASGEITAIISWKIQGEGLEGLGFGVPGEVALDRLGFEFADQSTADLVGMRGRLDRPTASEKVVNDDTPLPESRFAETGSSTERRTRRTLRVIGASSLIFGGGMVLGTWSVAQQDQLKPATWTGLQVLNTMGWFTGASGAVLLASGEFVGGTPGIRIGGRL